jgi:putative endopeptidase
MHTIAEKASQTQVDPKLAPETRKVGDYYASGMDEKAVEAARTTPLTEEFQKIDAMKIRQDVLKEIAHLHSIGINAFFNFGSGQDAKDSNHDIAQAVQGGLGMPDRDYYTKQDADMKEKREKYIAHVTKMLTLLGQPPEKAAEEAKKIMALETKLAEASRTRVELRDPIKNYNKMAAATAAGPDADWNWNDYFNSIICLSRATSTCISPSFSKRRTICSNRHPG